MPYPYFQNYPTYNPMLQQQLQNLQQQPPQIQNGGLVAAPSIEFAQNYSVAPGTSVMFKIESQPYICTKTLGFSQLDQPIFEIYRLIKEDIPAEREHISSEKNPVEYLTLNEADKIKEELNKIKLDLNFLKECIEMETKGEKNANES